VFLPVHRFFLVLKGSNRRFLRGFGTLVASSCLLIATHLTANAQTSWQANTGDWATAGNWTNGVPNLKTAAIIADNGTASILNLEQDFALSLNLGGVGGSSNGLGGSLTINGSDSELTVADNLAIGGDGGTPPNPNSNGNTGGTGTLTLSNGNLTVGNTITLGGNGGDGGAPGTQGGNGGGGTVIVSPSSQTQGMSSTALIVGGNGGNGNAGEGGNGGAGTLTINAGGVGFLTNVGGNGGQGGQSGSGMNTNGGNGGNGTVTLNAGFVNADANLNVGGNGNVATNTVGGAGGNGGNGTVAINGGGLSIFGDLFLGGNGAAGGSSFALTNGNGGNGQLTLGTNGMLLLFDDFNIIIGGEGGIGGTGGEDIAGNGGAGTLTLNGGRLDFLSTSTPSITVGSNGAAGANSVLSNGGSGGSGTLVFSGGILIGTPQIILGGNGGNGSNNPGGGNPGPDGSGGNGGNGVLTISGGSWNLGGLTLGANGGNGGNGGSSSSAIGGSGGNGGNVTITLSGGTLQTSGNLTLGGNGGNGGNGGSGTGSDGGSGGNGGNAAMTLSGGTLSLSGNITLGGSKGAAGTAGTGGAAGTGGSGGTGTLNLDNGTISAGTITVGANGVLTFGPTSGQTMIVDANITGLSTQTVTFSTAGTVDLNGTSDFGSVTINSAATLQLGNGTNNGTAGSGAITDNGALAFDVNGTQTLANNISGSGTVTQLGGTTLLTGNNTYSGTTTINAGTTLQAGSLTALSGNSAFVVNGTLDLHGLASTIGPLSGNGLVTNSIGGGITFGVHNTGTTTFGGVISDGKGQTAVVFFGSGTVILTGSNTYSGQTFAAAGVSLQLGNGGTTGSISNSSEIGVFDGTLTFDRSNALTISARIIAGDVLQEGTGTTTLVHLTNDGTTTVSAGTLQAGSTIAFSSESPFTVDTGATVDLNGFSNTIGSLAGSGNVTNNGSSVATLSVGFLGTSTTFSGTLTDGTSTLGLEVIQGATLTLTGANTYSGGTTIDSASTLQLGNGGTTGSITGNVTDDGSLVFDLSSTYNFSGAISGTGSVTQNGSGTTVLSGASSYNGATSVNSGALEVTGSLGSTTVTVASGATLAGNGTIGGPVTIQGGGILSPGLPVSTTPGTLTVGALTLNSTSVLNYLLGTTNVVGGGTNDLVQVNGNLTLAGILNITNVGGFGEGIYRLFNYTGALTDNGLTFGTLPSGITTSDLLLQTSQAGQINLLVSATGFTDQFWDGTNTVADGTIHGGSGTWDTTTTNWTNLDAKVNAPWQSGFAIFEGAAGTVTLGANIDFIGLQFVTTGYVITAGNTAFALTATQTSSNGGTIINVDPGVTGTIEAPITGPGQIVKTNAGTLILTGANTYTGGTTVSGGILQLGNGGTTGSITGDVVDNAVLAIDRSNAFAFAGSISGTGAFEQNGSGQTTLSGDNSYSGTTMVSSGILQAGSATGFSSNSQFIVDTGATLDLNGFSSTIGSLTGNGSVINSATATPVSLTLGGDNSNTTFAGVIGQAGSNNLALTKTGTGTLILTGVNLYSGGTTISSGTLQLGDGGTTGSITGNVTDSATFAIDRSNTYTFAGIISGTGAFEKLGKGTTILTGNNTYKGGTTITGGTLQIGDGGTKGSITGRVTDNGTLDFDRNDAFTFSGAIKGKGSVVQSGSGTLTLSGSNSYSGGTELDSGTLVVDNASALGTGDVTVTGGILTADPQPINVQGNYFQGPNGTLQLVIAGASLGQYDYLNVTGNATLGGTLQLINQGFVPKAGETLTLVQAGGAITNEFSHFVDPFTTGPGLSTIDLVYSLHSVDLEFLNITPPTPPTPPSPPKITTINFASFAQTPNELASAELLDAVELNPRFSGLLSLFLSQPFFDIPNELAIIAPESLTSFYEISFSDANIQRVSLENRLDEIRAGFGSLNSSATAGGIVGLQKASGDGKTSKNPVEPVLQPVVQPPFSLWASGFGDFVHVDSDYNARGYRFTTSGFDVGFDYRFLDHFAVGVMGNYTYTWTDLQPGTVTVNSGRGGVYASYFTGNYYLNGGVYGGYNSYDSNRRGLGGNAIGNTNGAEWSGFVSTGYDFHLGRAAGLAKADSNLTIGPMASLQYTNVNVSGFTETGSLLPMNIHSDSEESLRSDVGFRAYYQWQIGHILVEPFLKATWEHEFKYSALPITAGFAGFPGPNETFSGPAEGHDSAVLSAGLSIQWTPLISTYVSYDGQLGRDRYNSNAVSGGVRVSW
jgi:fibronectin-binding autotransporter adhesin